MSFVHIMHTISKLTVTKPGAYFFCYDIKTNCAITPRGRWNRGVGGTPSPQDMLTLFHSGGRGGSLPPPLLFNPSDFQTLIRPSCITTRIILGTIHLRRRHVLGGEGSRIGQICRQIVLKTCRREGGRGQKS